MSATTQKVLQMKFTTVDNKDVTVRLASPKSDLTAETVQAAMELFNDLRFFNVVNRYGTARLKSAKTVDTVTSEFGITVS